MGSFTVTMSGGLPLRTHLVLNRDHHVYKHLQQDEI